MLPHLGADHLSAPLISYFLEGKDKKQFSRSYICERRVGRAESEFKNLGKPRLLVSPL